MVYRWGSQRFTRYSAISLSWGVGLTTGVMTYILLDAPQHKEQEYIGFRMGISTVFKIFSYFHFVVGGVDPRGHELNTIGCPLTQGTKIYIV
jgi:hypothetical protein